MLRKDSIMNKMKETFAKIGGSVNVEESLNNMAKQDAKGFNYISTDHPAHLKVNPS
jgi:hypothetical protein